MLSWPFFATFSLYLWSVHFLICFLSSLFFLLFSFLLIPWFLPPPSYVPETLPCLWFMSLLLPLDIHSSTCTKNFANNHIPWTHYISSQYWELYCVIHLCSFARLNTDCALLLDLFLFVFCSCRCFSLLERNDYLSNPTLWVYFLFFYCRGFGDIISNTYRPSKEEILL